MNYPGNPALGTDVKQRIVATFTQTLDLAIAGNRQEALLGCDFVLRMDSQFEPARRLQERIHASSGALSHEALADLSPTVAAAPTAVADDDLGFLPGLDDLDGVEPLSDFVAADRGGLRDEFEQLFAEGRYDELVSRAHQESAALASEPSLGQLAMAAQEKLESAPYVAKFLAAARAALAAGQAAEAERQLEKARSLDPDNREIGEIARSMAGPGGADEASFFTLESAAPTALPSLEPTSAAPPAQSYASEGDRRIAQLLAEGDAAFDRGDPQAAIDSWSRIFLIDIDHDEAARRIERARRLKAESERQVEEVFHDGLSSGEAGDLVAARRAFERVLELQPTHLAAREQLQLLDAGQAPAPRPPAHGGEALDPLGPSFDSAPPADLKEEILVPPEEAADQPRRERKDRTTGAVPAAPAPARAKRTFVLVGAGVLTLVLVGAWLLFQNWDQLFPNSDNEVPAQASSADAIERAKKLQEQGKAAIAVAQLKRIPPTDPLYAQAQELIKTWDVPVAPPEAEAPSPEQAALRDQVLDQAREAYTSRAYLLAAERFKQGAGIAPLEGTDAELFEDAKKQLLPITTQIQLFRDHEWDLLLPQLWRLRESSPSPDIDRMLIESYYDLGVRELQRTNPTKALEDFREAAKLVQGDADLQRNIEFAQAYQKREPDLLYRIYVKYLKVR